MTLYSKDDLEIQAVPFLVLVLFWISLDLKYQKSFSALEQSQLTTLVSNTSPRDTAANYHQELQLIITKIIALLEKQGLPTEGVISITLVDVNTNTTVGYQSDLAIYPASLVKVFWLFYLGKKIANQQIPLTPELQKDIALMIRDSDNDAASRILDLITDTKSGPVLSEEEFKQWLAKRQKINHYFRELGYENINLEQKTYPIPSLRYQEPQGRELQMRGNPPLRNQISSAQAAKLMAEIVQSQGINQDLKQWLTWDLKIEQANLKTRNIQQFNPIYGFLGQNLPQDLEFISKAGWTSEARAEVAYIKTVDGKVAYILALLAEDRQYAENWQIFPAISQLVLTEMQKIK